MRLEQAFLLRAELLLRNGQLLKRSKQLVMTLSGARMTGCVEARGVATAANVEAIIKPIDV